MKVDVIKKTSEEVVVCSKGGNLIDVTHKYENINEFPFSCIEIEHAASSIDELEKEAHESLLKYFISM